MADFEFLVMRAVYLESDESFFDLENANQELKSDLKDLYINSAVQIDISGNWKAIVIHVPHRLRKGFRKLHVRHVIELEKKFSGKLCFSEDSNSFAQDGFGFGSNSWDHRLGYLYFHYADDSSPYATIPLMNKINEFARSYPGIKSLKSAHLSPASWMAVAWYPIYHSPTGRNVKDLSTSFLTYHTLSSSFQEMLAELSRREKAANIKPES